MIYQFADWRTGNYRRYCVGHAEPVLEKLRANNKGVLPPYLSHWDDICVFAGGFQIALHENENVARGMLRTSDGYPTVAWVAEQYAKMLAYLSGHAEGKLLLPDPAPAAAAAGPEGFDKLTERSVSNTEGENQCSAVSPPTSPTSSTSTASPNSSATATPSPSPPPTPSTPSPAPKTSSPPPKTKS